jgi:hypothetical protein
VIGLEEEMTYTVEATGPLETTEGSPWGARQYWEMSSATLRGKRISATSAMPGGDWMGVSGDGFWRPDVRVQFRTDDGAIVLMRYTGLVERTDAFERAATDDHETSWDDHYMRMAVVFETGDERYRWLNESLFVARGRLLGTGRVQYTIFRVT